MRAASLAYCVAWGSEAVTACGTDDEDDIDVEMDLTLDDGDVAEFEGFDLEVIGLPGHTPGQIGLLRHRFAGKESPLACSRQAQLRLLSPNP